MTILLAKGMSPIGDSLICQFPCEGMPIVNAPSCDCSSRSWTTETGCVPVEPLDEPPDAEVSVVSDWSLELVHAAMTIAQSATVNGRCNRSRRVRLRVNDIVTCSSQRNGIEARGLGPGSCSPGEFDAGQAISVFTSR